MAVAGAKDIHEPLLNDVLCPLLIPENLYAKRKRRSVVPVNQATKWRSGQFRCRFQEIPVTHGLRFVLGIGAQGTRLPPSMLSPRSFIIGDLFPSTGERTTVDGEGWSSVALLQARLFKDGHIQSGGSECCE